MSFSVEPGDDITCTFADRRSGGGSNQEYETLVLERDIRNEATTSFDEFWYEVDGGQMSARLVR